MNAVSSAPGFQSPHIRSIHTARSTPTARVVWLAALSVLACLATPAARAFVYETDVEFYSTGDFNGDGQTDIVIVDKAKTPMGEATDTVTLDAATLTLKKRSVSQGPMTLSFDVLFASMRRNALSAEEGACSWL